MDDSLKLNFKRELDALVTLRDELRLKAQLAKADVKDDLAALERKLELASEDLHRTKAHAQVELDSVAQATKALVAELKQGFESIKSRLS